MHALTRSSERATHSRSIVHRTAFALVRTTHVLAVELELLHAAGGLLLARAPNVHQGHEHHGVAIELDGSRDIRAVLPDSPKR